MLIPQIEGQACAPNVNTSKAIRVCFLDIVELGAAHRSLGAIIFHRRLAEAAPGEQALHEAVALGHPPDHVNHLAIQLQTTTQARKTSSTDPMKVRIS